MPLRGLEVREGEGEAAAKAWCFLEEERRRRRGSSAAQLNLISRRTFRYISAFRETMAPVRVQNVECPFAYM